jgi:hypothetical protein
MTKPRTLRAQLKVEVEQVKEALGEGGEWWTEIVM